MKRFFLIPVTICSCIFLEAVEPEFLPPADSTIDSGEVSGEKGSTKKSGKKGVLKAEESLETPWLTGPLLTPSGDTVPKGHFNFEPYIFSNNNTGFFNNHWHLHSNIETTHNINFQMLTQIGLTQCMDFSINPQFFFNWEGSQDEWLPGDFGIELSVQLTRETPGSWMPAIKFSIAETLPTGQYQNLVMKKLGTDAGGGGSWGTLFKFVCTKLWHFSGHHFLAARLSGGTQLFSNVKVNGANAYGGDSSTKGVVHPGVAVPFYLGLEYTMTRHWALALDLVSIYTAPTRFKGTTLCPVGNKTHSYTLSIAPAIEYNFNFNVGLIAGIWTTLVGRNTYNFINGVVAVNVFI